MNTAKHTKQPPTSVHIPPTLKAEILQLAKREERSFSQTLCRLARQSMQPADS